MATETAKKPIWQWIQNGANVARIWQWVIPILTWIVTFILVLSGLKKDNQMSGYITTLVTLLPYFKAAAWFTIGIAFFFFFKNQRRLIERDKDIELLAKGLQKLRESVALITFSNEYKLKVITSKIPNEYTLEADKEHTERRMTKYFADHSHKQIMELINEYYSPDQPS